MSSQPHHRNSPPVPSKPKRVINGEQITTPAEINRLLKRILANRCLLAVRVGPDPETYTSTMLELVPERGYLVLDELIPHRGHKDLRNDPHIDVRTRLEGVPVKFNSVVKSIIESGRSPYYKATLPDMILHAQRRFDFRVPVPQHKELSVTLHAEDGEQITGELRDISAGGFSARIIKGNIDAVSGTGRICQCTLQLPGDSEIPAAIEIRHIDNSDPRRPPRIGAQFIELDPREQRQIERLVAEIEREQARRR